MLRVAKVPLPPLLHRLPQQRRIPTLGQEKYIAAPEAAFPETTTLWKEVWITEDCVALSVVREIAPPKRLSAVRFAKMESRTKMHPSDRLMGSVQLTKEEQTDIRAGTID
jgi:hypothetical protein